MALEGTILKSLSLGIKSLIWKRAFRALSLSGKGVVLYVWWHVIWQKKLSFLNSCVLGLRCQCFQELY